MRTSIRRSLWMSIVMLAVGCVGAVEDDELDSDVDPALVEEGGLQPLVGRRTPPAPVPNDNSFDFEVRSRHDGGTGEVGVVGTFPYKRSLDQYDPEAGWLDGDRLAYHCAWTFLEYRGEQVARVFFNRIQYGVVLDRAMNEGTLTWEGDPWNQPGTQTDHPTACDEKYPPVEYEQLAGDPGPKPMITFSAASDGHTLEVRNYNNVVTGSGVAFKIAETSPTLTKVVMYQDTFPIAVAYYEALSSSVEKTTNID